MVFNAQTTVSVRGGGWGAVEGGGWRVEGRRGLREGYYLELSALSSVFFSGNNAIENLFIIIINNDYNIILIGVCISIFSNQFFKKRRSGVEPLI